MNNQDTLVYRFESQVQLHGAHQAISFQDDFLTYEQVNRMTNQLAHYLLDRSVHHEEPIAVCMERSPWLITSLWAIIKTGGVYVPLDPQHPKDRRNFIIQDNNIRKIIITSDKQPLFDDFTGELIILDQCIEELNQYSDAQPSVVILPQQLAYIIYTSGSTGCPKGVMIEHRSVVNYADWFQEYTSCKPKAKIDFSSKYIFDMAVTTSIIPLMLGLNIQICSEEVKKDPALYLKYCAEKKVNIIKITPSFFRILWLELRSHPIPLPDLKTIILGGEALATVDCAAWLSRYPEHVLHNEYGPTEATVAVSSFKITPEILSTLDKQVPIGRVGRHMSWLILDDHDKPCDTDQVGHLFLSGICLARGYLNQEVLTQQQFRQHPHYGRIYRTGDLCRRLADEHVVFEGRGDEQLKIRGFRVEPGEIEHCLMNLADIETAFVLAREDKHDEKRLVVYYLLKNENVTLENETIRKYLATQLPDYMIPAAYVRLESIPMTPNGKLDTAALPNPHYVTTQDFRRPKSELERKISQIWSEELDVYPIGLKDDFFELGGDSLLAARIMNRTRQELNKDISLLELYQNPCIEQLTKILEQKSHIEGTGKAVIHHETRKEWPLADFQFMLWMADLFEPKVKHLNIVGRRRYHGQLDVEKLNQAYLSVIKKHEIFSHRLSYYKPVQFKKTTYLSSILSHDLSTCTDSQVDDKLKQGLKLLSDQTTWLEREPWLKVHTYFLPDMTTEIHVCMPHIISDDHCIDILFDELSAYYEDPNRIEELQVSPHSQFYDYIVKEQQQIKAHLHQDILFWSKFLKDSKTYRFPSSCVVDTQQFKNFNYSTYQKIEEKYLVSLRKFCARHRVSLMDGWCALVTKALNELSPQDFSNDKPSSIFLNIVKSTRQPDLHQHTLGCFLRLEPVKISWLPYASLAELSQQIHAAVIEAEPHQSSPGMVKLASIHDVSVKKSRIKHFVFRCLVRMYLKLFPSIGLDQEYLNLCTQLSNFEKKNNFLININVLSHILKNKRSLEKQKGFDTHGTQSTFYHPDLIQVDHVLDVCLMRDPVDDAAYLVISANLTPEFRSKIANRIKQLLKNEVF